MTMFRVGKWVVVGLALWMLVVRQAKADVGSSSRFRPMSS